MGACDVWRAVTGVSQADVRACGVPNRVGYGRAGLPFIILVMVESMSRRPVMLNPYRLRLRLSQVCVSVSRLIDFWMDLIVNSHRIQ